MRGDKHPEPKGWGDNGEVSCTGFQVFSILGSKNKAVVQIGLALKSCPPDDSDGDGRKGRREKGGLSGLGKAMRELTGRETSGALGGALDRESEIWSLV